MMKQVFIALCMIILGSHIFGVNLEPIPKFEVGDCIKGSLFSFKVIDRNLLFYYIKNLDKDFNYTHRIRVGNSAFVKIQCP